MSKKKKKNNNQIADEREYLKRCEEMRREYEQELADRKARLAASKVPNEIRPDYVYINGMVYGFPREDGTYVDWDDVKEDVIKASKHQRNAFACLYCNGGNENPIGEFKGEILKYEAGRILFKKLWLQYDTGTYDDPIVEDQEDHVWMYDIEPFDELDANVGWCFKFKAYVYAYKRQDGTIDFGLKCPEDVEVIEKYQLPDSETKSIADTIRDCYDIVCETCMFHEQCYGDMCFRDEEDRENIVRQIYLSNPNNVNAIRKLLLETWEFEDKAYLAGMLIDLEETPTGELADEHGIAVGICPTDSALSPGDIILSIEGDEIKTVDDVADVVKGKNIGDSMHVVKRQAGSDEEKAVDCILFGRDTLVDAMITYFKLSEIAEIADDAAHASCRF